MSAKTAPIPQAKGIFFLIASWCHVGYVKMQSAFMVRCTNFKVNEDGCKFLNLFLMSRFTMERNLASVCLCFLFRKMIMIMLVSEWNGENKMMELKEL